jgi:hypothetical protein
LDSGKDDASGAARPLVVLHDPQVLHVEVLEQREDLGDRQHVIAFNCRDTAASPVGA